MNIFIIELVLAILTLFTIQQSVSIKQENVHLNKKINDDDNTIQILETKSGLSVDSCVEECKLRWRCSFVNYYRPAQMCYLMMVNAENTSLSVTTGSNGFIYAEKSDWNMTYYEGVCDNCSQKQYCQLSTNPQCISTGCGKHPTVNNSDVFGNRYIVGSVLNYNCQYPYTRREGSKSQILCQGNGTWTKLQIQCMYPCKDNWTWDNKNSCYLLEPTHKQYYAAKTNCELMSAHLVDIGSQEEANFLDIFTGGSDVYIGLNDISAEGEFCWSDNSNSKNIFTSWANGEPNNSNPDEEDCVLLRNIRWHDVRCTRYYRSICEYEL